MRQSPKQFTVQATTPVRHDCDGCSGDGQWFRGGIVNGRRVGTSGICYRCHGKGWQSDADRARNTYYDNRIRRIHA